MVVAVSGLRVTVSYVGILSILLGFNLPLLSQTQCVQILMRDLASVICISQYYWLGYWEPDHRLYFVRLLFVAANQCILACAGFI